MKNTLTFNPLEPDALRHPVPPHVDPFTEANILGTMMYPLKPKTVDYIRSILEPEDFFYDLHRDCFEWLGDQWDTGGDISFRAMRNAFAEHPNILNGIPGPLYFEYLFECSAPMMINMDDARRAVSELRRVRIMRDTAEITKQAFTDPKNTMDNVHSAAQQALTEIEKINKLTQGADEAPITLKDKLEGAREAYRTGNYPYGVGCKLRDLDQAIAGVPYGEMTILAGRPSMGKSALALAMGMNAAERGDGVLIISLEMPADDIYMRLASARLHRQGKRLEYAPIRQGRCSDFEIDEMDKAANAVRDLPMIVCDESGLTVSKINAQVRRARMALGAKGAELKLVIVDHIGLVRDSGRQRNKTDQVGEVSSALKTLAQNQKLAVLALCQLNRGVEGREDKRPDMADLRASGDLEQDAAVVMFIYRKHYYLERARPDDGDHADIISWEADMAATKNRADVLIRKNRNGVLCDVPIFSDLGVNDFGNWSEIA